MRLQSKGIDDSSIMAARRGSFMTLALTRSRWVRDVTTIQENTTVLPGLIFIVLGNVTPHFTLRSSPTHSRYSRAPCSRQIFPAFLAMRKYCGRFFFGTGNTYPS